MFELIPGQLSIRDIGTLLHAKQSIKLAKHAYDTIEKSHQLVQDMLSQDQTIYGINTGFGLLANTKIAKHELKTLQKRIILSHAAGVGEHLDEDMVKLIILLKINSLAQGYSGVSQSLVNQLIAIYNANICPIIPEQGSVGASGDLAPLAHLSLTLIGEGEVYFRGQRIPAKEALASAHLKPIVLVEKEGLALINGTQVSTAIAIMGLLKMQRNFAIASIAGALSLEAAAGSIKPFSALIAQAKRNKGQLLFSKLMEDLVQGSAILTSHAHCDRVQDPYSLRCQPQVMGAVWTYLNDSQTHLMNEANAVSDNPLICIETKQIISGGNFHAEITAFSADLIAIIGSEIGSISERRVALLIDSSLSGLPPFLVNNPGLNSGFMLAQVTAASLASENKTYAHPASVDSIPTSANQEDHVSMATFAAVKLNKVAENVLMILAIETLAANQGIDFRAPLKTSSSLQPYVHALRARVPFYDDDRYIGHDISEARDVITQYSYYSALRDELFHQSESI
ncbi:MAG: histidine ammonia-lyase [Legionellaceae bacterium]|nr:histidine ammonia-lyase [Legionellaceae bacterium]